MTSRAESVRARMSAESSRAPMKQISVEVAGIKANATGFQG